VVLWATGFIGARLTMPHAEPMTLLALRFAIAGTAMAALALAFRQAIPRGAALGHQAVAGLLIQATYLGGAFGAIRLGLEAGATALIVGVQPVLAAALAGPVLGERVSARQWAGLLVGVAGVLLVVSEKLGDGLGTLPAVALAGLALVAISVGTLYQKRFCAGQPILSGTAVQYAVSAAACLALALLLETMRVEWTGELLLGLAWLVVVLSLGTVTLLYWLIARGAAAKVASLFFLVPPVAALMGFLLFGERMGGRALLGLGLAALGVALVNAAATAPRRPR